MADFLLSEKFTDTWCILLFQYLRTGTYLVLLKLGCHSDHLACTSVLPSVRLSWCHTEEVAS